MITKIIAWFMYIAAGCSLIEAVTDGFNFSGIPVHSDTSGRAIVFISIATVLGILGYLVNQAGKSLHDNNQ